MKPSIHHPYVSHDVPTANELMLQNLPLLQSAPTRSSLQQVVRAESLLPVPQSMPPSVLLLSPDQRKERLQMLLQDAMDLLNDNDFQPAVFSTSSRVPSRNNLSRTQ